MSALFTQGQMPPGPKESPVIEITVRFVVPIIQIFALYVIFHGHYSPGGGFQGGALLAASILLQRLVLGRRRSETGFKRHWGTPFGIVGVGLFFLTGLIPLFFGGNFLQYEALPFGLGPVWNRYWGILLVEIGVAFAVMGTLVAIFDELAGEHGSGDASLDGQQPQQQGGVA